jgi:hypothetical protein
MNSKGKQMKADPSRYDMRSELEDKSGFKVLGNSHVFKYDEHGGWYDEYSNYYNKDNKPSNPPGIKQKPDGSRFEKFTLTKDETGFTIPGSDRVYYFDVYGGWYDEFDNYYSKEGVPTDAPEYSDSDRTFDRFEREYDDYDDDDEDDILAAYAKEANRKRLENMKGDIEFQVKNINYKATEDDFEDFLKKEKIDFITFEFEYLDDGRSRGIAYVTLTKANAEKFIDLDNKAFKGRKIAISLWNDKSEESQFDVESPGDEIIAKQDNKINLDAYEAEDVVEIELANLDEKTTVEDISKFLAENQITVDDVDTAFDKETYAPNISAFIYLAKNQAEKLLALPHHKILGQEAELIVSEPGYEDDDDEGEEGEF